ncbi:extradiol ring-cleavage dioxygenase [Pseudomonas sp. MAFF212428]|uniref:Extradiol ring-cleavage dioxygenase n=1 Tax=Pseudomonas brassicae TaxID=2708063 RepID=A0A6B3NNX8_9PSED|nr:extradiol ring-cleavage dioxygenase [Pseudomonas brassicae]NER61269.1 extradiol ring-cleavage dioxygenase [Pseudomonas brassicae]NER62741.1 extradiol ring-cleavage dioxygenase [Pseudomonas brassicae]
MSRNLMERVLWQLCVERAAKQRFGEDPAGFLARFALEPGEVQMIVEFDVAGLQAAGVNPMLTMGFWQELAPQRDMRLYKQRLGATNEQGAGFSAALKG